MVCSNCGNGCEDGERFCRKCGTDLAGMLVGAARESSLRKKDVTEHLTLAPSRDPDELTGNGIASVIMGDGFLMVAVILSVTHTAASSLLWLLLLIPAFFFFGKGFADVLLARQIRRRLKQKDQLDPSLKLSPPGAPVAEVFVHHGSGELVALPSVTERTTRQLE